MQFKLAKHFIVMANRFGLLLILSLISHAVADEELPGHLIRVFGGRFVAPSCSNHYGPLCSDCNTLMTCVGDDNPVAVQNCEKTYPGRPLCINNACVSQTTEQHSNCAAPIRCTAAGYFPNPSNCAQFFLCSGPSGTARVYECPSGFAYNPLTTLCKRRFLESDCIQINCTGNPNRYVAYSGDRGYYAYCMNTAGVSSPIMFKCPDFVNFKFNEPTQQCQLECQAEGRVPDYANCRGYYECFREKFGFFSKREDCGDFAYDPTVQQCIPGPCFNTTSVAITTTTPRTTTQVAAVGAVAGD